MSKNIFKGVLGLAACLCLCWAASTAIGIPPKPKDTSPSKDGLSRIDGRFLKSDGAERTDGNPAVEALLAEGAADETAFQSNAAHTLGTNPNPYPLSAPSGIAAPAQGPSPHGAACAEGALITENNDPVTVIAGNSVACGAGALTAVNHYARCFESSHFLGIDYLVNCIQFGIENSTSTDGNTPITVSLQATVTPAGGPACDMAGPVGNPSSAWQPADTVQAVVLAGDGSLNGTILEVALAVPLLVPAGSGLMVQILAPDLTVAPNRGVPRWEQRRRTDGRSVS